jgi:hypothetical protein
MMTEHKILDLKRNCVDTEADRLVEKIMLSGGASTLYEVVSRPVEQLSNYLPADPDFTAFLLHKPDRPLWLDEGKLKRAADFYYQYALEIMMLLGAVSLPTCYAATPGNKVLYLSQKIRQKPGKRLLETASFVITISQRGAFEADGAGYLAVQQVRLIHALARYHILKSGKWDPAWGMPVNEEDMLGTNLAFSYTVLKALKDSGFPLPDEDLSAYLHLWKWVGYIMGIDDTLLTDQMEEAARFDLFIRERNFKNNTEGEVLTRSLIDHYREALPKGLGFLVEGQIKFFVGSEVGEMLNLKSSRAEDLFIKNLAHFMRFYNRLMPHRPTFHKMIKDHERLRKMYFV